MGPPWWRRCDRATIPGVTFQESSKKDRGYLDYTDFEKVITRIFFIFNTLLICVNKTFSMEIDRPNFLEVC
jgi:hypothetical protein